MRERKRLRKETTEIRAHAVLLLAIAMVAGGCRDASAPADASRTAPPGADVVSPFPIDRGDDPGTPGTYKGLWLRLVDNGEPEVTPVDGVIGVVCIGMSNGNQECSDFIQRVATSLASEVNPAVRVVNCAVGGNAIERWIDPAFDDRLWDACRTNRLTNAGVRLDQVRVIWHKAADQFTTAGGSAKPLYPDPASDYAVFLANLATFASRVRVEFPSVQAVYTSSRSYGGFAGNAAARGEPLSYEEGHALNTWLRETREVDGVWYGWGPYLWAPDCATGEHNGGGVCYVREDYVADGVHPAGSGRAKVSALLHARFLEEAWYRR